jgi:hypothetical protein
MDQAVNGERVLYRLPIRIGRNALNDCQILHPFVSDFHAVIEGIEGRLFVRDLQSKNGIYDPSGARIAEHAPVDLTGTNNEVVIGKIVHVRVEPFEQHQPVGARVSSAQGAVIGNRAVLESDPHDSPLPPRTPSQPAMPGAGLSHGIPSLPPLSLYGGPGPAQVPLAPVAPARADASGGPWGQRDMGQSLGLPPIGPIDGSPRSPPLPGPGRPLAHAPPPPDGVGRSTQHFALTTEALALLGLRELASSLVPGVPLETTGDVARLLTKLHDAVEVFCRCFVPLREGYAQFVSSMDLNRAASQRSLNCSPAAMRVETARDPAAIAAALLDWRNQSYDAPGAVEGIFADLMIHHVAIVEGVMRGVKALLEELSPDGIERAFAEESRAAFLGHHRALWKTYQRRYDEVANETRSFELVFGPEFAASYRDFVSRQPKNS